MFCDRDQETRWGRRWTGSCVFAVTFSLISIGLLPGSVIRIDGGFTDWEGVIACACDPQGDARGAFDIAKVYAASQGSLLYLRFETGSFLNLQNGPETEGTLLVMIGLPDNRRLTLDTRGRRAYLGDEVDKRIPWDRLKYIVGPTYAQSEFEIQIDLGGFKVGCGDTISIQFGGSDELTAPLSFTLAQPWETPKRRSHHRDPGTDVRIVSLNTYFEGLSDPNREGAMGRALNSVDGDVYCFQEEWKTEGHAEILQRLMPLEDGSQWHVHKVHGNVIASKNPLRVLPSKNSRYAAACIKAAANDVFVINAHLSATGYTGSQEDGLRIRQIDDILDTIKEIYGGQYDDDDTPGTRPRIVIIGDFNLVGSRTPLDRILGKRRYGLKDWLVPNLIGESVITWRGGPRASFSPGKLDYVVYSSKTLVPKNGFILNSELLNQTERKQLKLDVADSTLSDHLLLTVDFQFLDSGRRKRFD